MGASNPWAMSHYRKRLWERLIRKLMLIRHRVLDAVGPGRCNITSAGTWIVVICLIYMHVCPDQIVFICTCPLSHTCVSVQIVSICMCLCLSIIMFSTCTLYMVIRGMILMCGTWTGNNHALDYHIRNTSAKRITDRHGHACMDTIWTDTHV